MKLTFEDFKYDDNGKPCDVNNIPTQAETNNFFFEGNFINSLIVYYNWSTPTGVSVGLVKKSL